MRRPLLVALAGLGVATTGCLGVTGAAAPAQSTVVRPAAAHVAAAAKAATKPATKPAKPVDARSEVGRAVRTTVAAGSVQVNGSVRALGLKAPKKGVDVSRVLSVAGNLDFAHHRLHADVYVGQGVGQPQESLARVMVSEGQIYVSFAGMDAPATKVKDDEGPLSFVQVLQDSVGPVRAYHGVKMADLGTVTVYRVRSTMGVTCDKVNDSLCNELTDLRGIRDIYVDGQGRLVGTHETVDLSNTHLSGLVGAKQLVADLRFSGFGVDVYQHVPKKTTKA